MIGLVRGGTSTLTLDLDDPFVTQELTAAVAVALREDGYTVHPARPDHGADQPMGGSLLEIGQQILANKDLYTAWLNAITTIVKVLHARQQARVTARQEARAATLTADAAKNAVLLRDLILNDKPVTVTVTDRG